MESAALIYEYPMRTLTMRYNGPLALVLRLDLSFRPLEAASSTRGSAEVIVELLNPVLLYIVRITGRSRELSRCQY